MSYPQSEALAGIFPRADEYSCTSDRASDYYGLGVRLGIYFIWLQGWIANTMLPSEIGSAATSNTVFILTLFIAMTKDSLRGHLAQIDGLVLMHLCGGATFGVLSIWGYRTRLYVDNGPKAVGYFGSWGTHARVILSFAISIYGLWFWAWGITSGGLRVLGPGDGMEEADPGNPAECSVLYTFLFAKLPINGGIRYFYIVVSAGCAIYFGAMMLVSVLTAWFTIDNLAGKAHQRWSRDADHGVEKSLHRPRYVTGFKQQELTFMHKSLRVMNLTWLLFSAVMVEVTLNFNHLNDVLGGPTNNLSSPGQLLPLLVGAFGFTVTCYQLAQDKLFEKHKRGKLFQRQNFGPETLRSTTGLDRQQQERSIFIRYLVGWLPWLSLLQHFDEELLAHGISRQGTELGSQPTTPGFSGYASSPGLEDPKGYRRAPTVDFVDSPTFSRQ
jgi:hypothetical protein